MHTRRSGKTSPLLFDPEIEKTARHNRVLHRASLQSPEKMETQGDPGKHTDLPPADQIPQQQQHTSGTFSSSVPPNSSEGVHVQSSSQIPPLPSFGQTQPQVTQPFSFKPEPQYSSPYVRVIPEGNPLTSQPPPNRPLFPQYQPYSSIPTQTPHPHTSGLRYEDEYEDDNGSYDDLDTGFVDNVGGRIPLQTGFGVGADYEGYRAQQHDTKYAQQSPPVFQANPPHRATHIPQQQPPVNTRPRRPDPRQNMPPPPVVNQGGIPRRHDRGPIRGIESHFRPAIANNP